MCAIKIRQPRHCFHGVSKLCSHRVNFAIKIKLWNPLRQNSHGRQGDEVGGAREAPPIPDADASLNAVP
jgi:hypothetical protein